MVVFFFLGADDVSGWWLFNESVKQSTLQNACMDLGLGRQGSKPYLRRRFLASVGKPLDVMEEEKEEDEEASSDEDEPAAAGVEDAGAPTPAKKGRGRPRKQADAAVGTTQPSRQPISEPARQSSTPVVRNSAATTRRPVRNSRRNSALGPGDAPPAAESIRRMAKDDKALDAKSAEELRSQVFLKKKLIVFVYTLNHVP